MPRKLRIAYFAHTLRSDWNNGNAHFLRGLVRALRADGHEVTAYEPESEWSIQNLRAEDHGQASLDRFMETYADLDIQTYGPEETEELWRERLRGTQFVLLHEWNPPLLAQLLLKLRDELGFKLLFHDTHHRASSSPESFAVLGLERFDGVLAFGAALQTIYRERFGVRNVWVLHEAADTTVFRPMADVARGAEIVWIGNWGEGERTEEIRGYLLEPAAKLAPAFRTKIYGVRYPEEGHEALRAHGVEYGGYLPNLDAPRVYASARLTVHIPRQQYTKAMTGIPTIRVFEALACGIPLVSAPWQDTEGLFRSEDFYMANAPADMEQAMRRLLESPALAAEQARRGRETVLARHTCEHRAAELAGIFEELGA
ncbi:MAG TPA: glycosyltransferase [Acidobacteriaceae bacterium]|jgi:spore maturation protein CgeB|nr:glycosyltransferase [Acidobacteriaceae bacterium]